MTRPLSEFDPDWKYGHQTRDGRSARIICKDRKAGHFKIIALIDIGTVEIVREFIQDGVFSLETKSLVDLFNKPAPKVKRWVVYDSTRMPELCYHAIFFDTEFRAKNYQDHQNSMYRTDCYKIKEVEFDIE